MLGDLVKLTEPPWCRVFHYFTVQYCCRLEVPFCPTDRTPSPSNNPMRRLNRPGQLLTVHEGGKGPYLGHAER